MKRREFIQTLSAATVGVICSPAEFFAEQWSGEVFHATKCCRVFMLRVFGSGGSGVATHRVVRGSTQAELLRWVMHQQSSFYWSPIPGHEFIVPAGDRIGIESSRPPAAWEMLLQEGDQTVSCLVRDGVMVRNALHLG